MFPTRVQSRRCSMRRVIYFLATFLALALLFQDEVLGKPAARRRAESLRSKLSAGKKMLGRRDKWKRQNAARWKHKGYADSAFKAAAKHLLHERDWSSEQQLLLPLEIEVVLMGMEEDGAFGVTVNTDELQALLASSLSEHCPTILSTGQQMSACYGVTFNVNHAEVDTAILETAMYEAMEKVGEARTTPYDPANESPRDLLVVELEATRIEPVLNRLLDDHYANQKAEVSEGAAKKTWRNENVILVINPSKHRMTQFNKITNDLTASFAQRWDGGLASGADLDIMDGTYRYSWRYNGVGNSASWLSSSQYVVVDLSAGRCEYGPAISTSGSVTATSIPDIAELFSMTRNAAILHNKHRLLNPGSVDDKAGTEQSKGHAAMLRETLLRGHLSSIVQSAAHHVFMPDVKHPPEMRVPRVLLPVLVFRNHQVYNPLAAGESSSLDLDDIQDAARTLIDADQSVSVVSGLHQLSQHPSIDVALQSSIFSRSEPVTLPNEGMYAGIHSRTVYYLDGRILLEQLSISADVLVETLLVRGAALKEELYKEGMEQRVVTGTHVVPVFVFSLVGVPPGLQFMDGGMVYSNSQASIVLQTSSLDEEHVLIDTVDSGHYIEDSPVMYQSMEATRHVVAGFAASYSGMVPPFEQFSSLSGRTESSWLWSSGQQPFGPYSNATTMSTLLQSVSKRSMLLSRMDKSVKSLSHTLRTLDTYLLEHLGLPFGVHLGSDRLLAYSDESLLDLLLQPEERRAVTDLPKRMIEELSKVVSIIQDDILELSAAFFRNEFGRHEDELARAIEAYSKALEQVLQQDPAQAMLRVGDGKKGCCSIKLARNNNMFTVLAGLSGMLLAAAVFVFLF